MQETTTRIRNAFARLALELSQAHASPSVSLAFAPPFSSMTAADWRKAVLLWRPHAAELLASLPARECPACGSVESHYIFDSYDGHAFHECARCGCWFTPKVVDWSVFERLFERSPEARAHAVAMMTGRDQEVRNADMKRIGAYLDDLRPLIHPARGRVSYLDVGCGVGHSLRAGLERGLTVQGVDVDDAAVGLARKAGLPAVMLSELASIPRGPYQLITFWETLEHIADPLEMIQTVVPVLAEDGIVAITVPNLNALATRAMRAACEWVHGGYNTPGHVNLFHVRALECLLARAGLTLLEADGQYSGNPVELLSFLTGATRGAFDALETPDSPVTVPEQLADTATAVWPGVELLERLSLRSPILRVVACRTPSAPLFERALAERRERRRQQVAADVERLIAFETDYKKIADELQDEINRRDADIVRLAEERAAAVSLRDKIIDNVRAERDRAVEVRDTIVSDLAGRSPGGPPTGFQKRWRRLLVKWWR